MIDRVAALDPEDKSKIDENASKVLCEKFASVLDNDINTSLAVTVLYDVLKYSTNDNTKLTLLDKFDSVLGLGLISKAQDVRRAKANQSSTNTSIPNKDIVGEGDPEIDALVALRQKARTEKNWTEADRIRDELSAKGISIIDTKDGVRWTRS